MAITEPYVAQERAARILVVEDDPHLRSLVAFLLAGMGYRVLNAGCAEAALELLRDESPDLVLLDVHLPGEDGLDLLDRIRSSITHRLLPVILMTGGGTRRQRLRALGSGMTDFLEKPFDPEELAIRIRGLLSVKRTTDRMEEAEKVIVALARAVDARDGYTAGHSDRVARYATAIARRLEVPPAMEAAIHTGCMFHDIGKIVVPDAVLFKDSSLDVSEFEQMKRHPIAGGDLVSPLRTLADSMPIVVSHHERLDGSGYPFGIGGDELSLAVRISSIADVFDALTTARPYRAAHSAPDALEILGREAARGWWDRDVLAVFREIAAPLFASASRSV